MKTDTFQPGDKVLLGQNANVCSPQWVEFLSVLKYETDEDGDIYIKREFEAFRFDNSLWTPEKLGGEVEAYLGVTFEGEEPIAFVDCGACEDLDLPSWVCMIEQCIAEGLLIVPAVPEPAAIVNVVNAYDDDDANDAVAE